jgi:hypothetical protein
VLAARRIGDGLAGMGELHTLVVAHTEDPVQVAVGIETDRGLLVGALVAMLRRCNQQVTALEEQLAARFGAHPDAVILRSQTGLGAALGARVLGEFGDDPDRYATAKGRKAFAGTAPITRSSGLRTVVVARGRMQPAAGGCLLPVGVGQPAGGDLARLPCQSGRLPGAAGLAGSRGGRQTTAAGCLDRPGSGGAAGRDAQPSRANVRHPRPRWLTPTSIPASFPTRPGCVPSPAWSAVRPGHAPRGVERPRRVVGFARSAISSPPYDHAGCLGMTQAAGTTGR